MNIKKLIFIFILVIPLTFLFCILNEGEISNINQLIQPFIFALTFSIGSFIPSLRKLFLIISLSLVALMIFVYFFNLLDLSNWLGSLGYGMLLMIIFTYLPDFVKRGQIEKF